MTNKEVEPMRTMPNEVDRAVDDVMSGQEVGLQLAVYHRGELVMERSAGRVSEAGEPVSQETVFWTASAGKVSTATALHMQVERGLLSYDQTIASVWPEFGAHGKEAFTVRDALTHRVGLADLPPDVTPELLGDWDWMTGRLAATAPSAAEPQRNAYHPRTWGYVVGEIVRRVDPRSRSFEEIVRAEVHEPLRIDGVWHRLPAEVEPRAALVKGDILAGDPIRITVDEDHEINSSAYRDRIDPSGAWMTACGGARLWALFAQGGALDGNRLLSADSVRSFLRPRACTLPAGSIAGARSVIGAGGLMIGAAVPEHGEVLGFQGNSVLWHPGGGGAVGFADLDAELAVMICHNELFDERPHAAHPFAPIVRAVYADVVG